ncbi:MAG TPA: tetratricopeptide repeat protein [Pyrinomonadaceae bacterium]
MSKPTRSLLKIIPLLLLIVISSSYAGAQTPALWGDLKSGSYSVGFRFIYKHDYSRGWKAKEDANGYPQAESRGRPIRVSVWYPARKIRANAARMLYRDYMPFTGARSVFAELNSLLEKRDADNLRANLKGDEFNSLMMTRMAAVQNAVPHNGTFPLIVYSAGLNNSSQDNVVLCEYLASHGYVVVTVPQLGTTSLDVNLKFQNALDLETQALDLQHAIGAVHDFPNIDRHRLGVIGYSVGGVVGLNLVMRDTDVDAIVTLDPTFGVTPFIKLATSSPYYAPANVRVPWMYMYRVEPATNLAVFDTLKYSNRYRLELTGMLHQDFSSFPMFGPQSTMTPTRTPETAKRGYQTVCHYTLNFFNAYLKGDGRALEFISRVSQGSGAVENIAKFEIRNGIQPPPTEEKFLRVMEQGGFEHALKLYNESRSRNPQQPVFSETFLNQLGYRLINQNRLEQAMEIFKLNVDAYPSSANVYDSLAEAYTRSGNREMAIKFYEKSIELNPNNRDAIEALKKLKGNP